MQVLRRYSNPRLLAQCAPAREHPGGPGVAPRESTAALVEADRRSAPIKGQLVEVGGIEPPSYGNDAGLLRAQPARRFLSPGTHAGKLPTGSVAVGFPYHPRDRVGRLSLLTMPDPGPETLPG